jgi:hypothetical protein
VKRRKEANERQREDIGGETVRKMQREKKEGKRQRGKTEDQM